jgi:hypothetical protein
VYLQFADVCCCPRTALQSFSHFDYPYLKNWRLFVARNFKKEKSICAEPCFPLLDDARLGPMLFHPLIRSRQNAQGDGPVALLKRTMSVIGWGLSEVRNSHARACIGRDMQGAPEGSVGFSATMRTEKQLIVLAVTSAGGVVRYGGAEG